ncbi:SdpI family protein [Ruania alkalisoli]|uniref:SdpI family protein n=1 Tax=Ruania alkalisoli TaxID=2779775 RepID=A0A7M1SPU1_9MICO|nr:SdpI family protein [Ruania alkalisoli]QOR69578.1 SdpI family protein [Ruania alkalisoli]
MTEADVVALTATGVLVVAAGLLLVVVARRAAQGRIRRNPIAGIRTAATMASDEAWLAAHREGESLTALGGWIFVATGAVTMTGARLGAEAAWLTAVLIAECSWRSARSSQVASAGIAPLVRSARKSPPGGREPG